MTEHLLEVENAPALPQIVDRKRVQHGMNAPLRWLETERSTQKLEVAENIPASLFCPALSSEDIALPRFGLSLKKEQPFSEFKRDRDEPVFAALAMQQHEQIVEGDVFPVKTQRSSSGSHFSEKRNKRR